MTHRRRRHCRRQSSSCCVVDAGNSFESVACGRSDQSIIGSLGVKRDDPHGPTLHDDIHAEVSQVIETDRERGRPANDRDGFGLPATAGLWSAGVNGKSCMKSVPFPGIIGR